MTTDKIEHKLWHLEGVVTQEYTRIKMWARKNRERKISGLDPICLVRDICDLADARTELRNFKKHLKE
jgi:hypothetical protein